MNGREQTMQRHYLIGIRQLAGLALLPMLLLAMLMLAGAQLEAALAVVLAQADAGQMPLLLLNLMLGVLALPALAAAGLLWYACGRQRGD
jgi:uncharacterized membrane protein YjgN (DUF898 family)